MRLGRRFAERTMVAGGLLLVAAGTGGLLVPGLPSAMVGAAVAGFGVPPAIVGLFTALQRYTPAALQGRVAAAVDTLITVPQVLSTGAGAILVSLLDYRLLLAGTVLVVSASAGWLAWRTSTRAGTRPQAVPVPDGVPALDGAAVGGAAVGGAGGAVLDGAAERRQVVPRG
jgi:hypothetical protein